MTVARVVQVPNVWRLGVERPFGVAAQSWRSIAGCASNGHDGLAASISASEALWHGDSGDAYRRNRAHTAQRLEAVWVVATRGSSELEQADRAVHTAQRYLDAGLRSVAAVVPTTVTSERVSFDLGGDLVVARVRAELVAGAVRHVRTVRDWVRRRLNEHAAELAALGRQMARRGPAYRATETEGGPVRDYAAVIGTPGNDVIRVVGKDSKLEVTVNGKTKLMTQSQVELIAAGAGDDIVTIGPGVPSIAVVGGAGNDTIDASAVGAALVTSSSTLPTGMRLDGGDGDDVLRGGGGADRLYSKAGNDRVSGGGGDDYISGGLGNDQVYGGTGSDILLGLSGNDRVYGGGGRDYLDGGAGADTMDGGGGDDVVSGGRGTDALSGGAGNDTLYAGRDSDAVDGGAGKDRAYLQSEDGATGVERRNLHPVSDAASHIVVTKGSDEFRDRVQGDLEFLRSSPTGARVLNVLQEAHDKWGIPFLPQERYAGQHIEVEPGERSTAPYSTARFHPMTLSSDIDEIRPAPGTPPSVVLHHELNHYRAVADGSQFTPVYEAPDVSGSANYELITTGLPVTGPDGGPPRLVDYEFSENKLREEMGWRERTQY